MSENEEPKRPLAAGRHLPALGLAALLGGAVWLGISLLSVHAEAFDDHRYFALGLPTIALGCALLGYWAPHKAWRYGIVAMATHAVGLLVLVIRSGAPGLVAVGLGFFALLAVPMALAGVLGAWFRERED